MTTAFFGLNLSYGQIDTLKRNDEVIQDYDSTFVNGLTESLSLYRIEKIPINLCFQKQIKSLSIIGYDCDYGISCESLGELPICIANMLELKSLSYSVTGISFIPDTLKNLSKLKILSLTDNSALKDISNIKHLQNIEVLSLFGCTTLKNIVNDVKPLKQLKILNLEGCNSITKAEIIEIKKSVPKSCKVTSD